MESRFAGRCGVGAGAAAVENSDAANPGDGPSDEPFIGSSPRTTSIPAAWTPAIATWIIGVIEQRLNLRPGQRPDRGACLVVGNMDRGVPLVADLDRVGAEQLHALVNPAVTRVGEVRAEQRDRVLVSPDR